MKKTPAKRKEKYAIDQKVIDKLAIHLKRLRAEKDLSQQELADTADISKSQVTRIESRTLNPTLGTLSAIAKALEIPLKDLFDF